MRCRLALPLLAALSAGVHAQTTAPYRSATHSYNLDISSPASLHQPGFSSFPEREPPPTTADLHPASLALSHPKHDAHFLGRGLRPLSTLGLGRSQDLIYLDLTNQTTEPLFRTCWNSLTAQELKELEGTPFKGNLDFFRIGEGLAQGSAGREHTQAQTHAAHLSPPGSSFLSAGLNNSLSLGYYSELRHGSSLEDLELVGLPKERWRLQFKKRERSFGVSDLQNGDAFKDQYGNLNRPWEDPGEKYSADLTERFSPEEADLRKLVRPELIMAGAALFFGCLVIGAWRFL